MRIAVTGVTGFIGLRLLNSLSAKYGNESITPISSRPIEGFDCVIYDENMSFQDEIQCEVLIHAGAYTPKNSSQANIISKCNSNIFFTEMLLSNVSLAKLKKIVNLSSLDVYAGAEKLDETSSVGPLSLYGMSKLYCEKMVHSFATENNIEARTLRIGHVYGPGEEAYQKVLPLTISKIINNQPVEIWGDGSELRSFIHVDDVVTTIVRSTEIDFEPEVINVVSGNALSIRELVSMLISISTKDIKVTYSAANYPSRDLVFDNSLLKKYLLPTERDLGLGLEEEYEYMKAKHEHNF